MISYFDMHDEMFAAWRKASVDVELQTEFDYAFKDIVRDEMKSEADLDHAKQLFGHLRDLREQLHIVEQIDPERAQVSLQIGYVGDPLQQMSLTVPMSGDANKHYCNVMRLHLINAIKLVSDRLSGYGFDPDNYNRNRR